MAARNGSVLGGIIERRKKWRISGEMHLDVTEMNRQSGQRKNGEA